MTIVYLSMGALSLSLFFAAGPVVSFFGLTPAAARMAVEVLRWCSVFTAVFWPMAFVLPNALRAAGDARFTMIDQRGPISRSHTERNAHALSRQPFRKLTSLGSASEQQNMHGCFPSPSAQFSRWR